MKERTPENALAPWNDASVRWVCEEHPTKDAEHTVFNWRKFRFEECGGAGMPEGVENLCGYCGKFAYHEMAHCPERIQL